METVGNNNKKFPYYSVKVISLLFLLMNCLTQLLSYYFGLTDIKKATKAICRSVVNHNILFVKVFQYLSSFSTELPNTMLEVFKDYTANAFTSEHDIDKELLDYISTKYNVDIVDTPKNAGMIAISFIATQRETKLPLLIKMKKKQIDEQIRDGCAEICFFYKYLRYWSWASSPYCSPSSPHHHNEEPPETNIIELLQPFVDNITNIQKQCDFDREIETLEKANLNLGILREFISIPSPYNDEVDRVKTRFIVMDYMSGQHGIPKETTLEDCKEYARLVTLYSMFHTMRPFHILNMDLHEGNLLLTYNENGRPHLNIIDFGMAEQLTTLESTNFSKLLYMGFDYYNQHNSPPSGTTITNKYDVVELFEVIFEDFNVESLLKQDKEKYKQLNEKLNMFIIELLSGSVEPDQKIMYRMLKAVNDITGRQVRFTVNAYNYVLGLAIGNKMVMNYIGHDMMMMKQLYEQNIQYLLLDE